MERHIALNKWPMPTGYSVGEALLAYDGQWRLEFTLVTPQGKHRAAQVLYPEQVLVCDSYAFGRDVVEHIVNELTKEEPLAWQL